MICASYKQFYPKVYVLSISLPHHYYKANMPLILLYLLILLWALPYKMVVRKKEGWNTFSMDFVIKLLELVKFNVIITIVEFIFKNIC